MLRERCQIRFDDGTRGATIGEPVRFVEVGFPFGFAGENSPANTAGNLRF